MGVTSPTDWKDLPPLPDAEFADLAASAPPMRGIEYLDASVLRRFWSELAALVAQRAATWSGGATAFLQSVDPHFHPVGRVTFHLAENKREPARPFAFLATYTHRVSDRAKVVHLPLADALKEYAGARDAVKLKSLLTPVERAAEMSGLVREMMQTRALFAQAWSIRQAYRFLKEAARWRRRVS